MDKVNTPQEATQKPDPREVPFEAELNAMRTCAIDFDGLNYEQRRRVWQWLAQRYDLRFRDF